MKKLILLLIAWFTFTATAILFAQSGRDCDTDAALIIEDLEGATPWTSLELNNNPCQFQFAIVTDRTGGHRPGIFMEGVRRLNLLQPEFVMSVGDLIEGYTENLNELNRQWDEFNGFIGQLEMPFFRVPGNHDITNKVMEKLWLEKYGKTYYHFVYKDVLFLCLNSEDQCRGAGRGSISTPQYDYIKQVLAENPNVKWTLLFMHQPLWNQENPERWQDVEKLLADRKHTVFVGHVHHYAKYERNNGKYFTLATTGGGSRLRGPQIGEFDHVTWITMTDDGPVMANLQLEGIWDENVSTEKSRKYLNELARKNPIQIEPLLVEGDVFREGQIRIKITNDEDVPMSVKLKERFSWDLKGSMGVHKMEVGPNSVAFTDLTIEPRRTKSLDELGSMEIKAEVSYVAEELPQLDVPFSFSVGPEKKYYLHQVQKPVKIDGKLDEWRTLPYTVRSPSANDASALFTVAYDETFLYVAARIKDDDLQIDPTATVWNQDYAGFVINADPLIKSAMDQGSGWYRNSLLLLQTPATQHFPSRMNDDALPKGGVSVCKATEEGYLLETAVPLSYIEEKQGANWQSVRINFVMQDQDAGENEKPRYTFKPDWRSNDNRIGSGMFFRQSTEATGSRK